MRVWALWRGWGGDEFVSVAGTADREKLASLMEQLERNIDRKNRAVKDLNMSIAYGYASGSQSDSDIEKVYRIADDRMYEKKKQMKGVRRKGYVRDGLSSDPTGRF